jgi:hypothetical protein
MRSSPTSLASACALAVAVAACGNGTNGGGGGGLTCSDPNAGITFPGGCAEAAVDTAAIAGAQHLGNFAVGETAAFTVPPGTASVTIVEQAVSGAPVSITLSQPGCAQGFVQSNVAVPLKVTDPAGVVVYDDSTAPNDPEAAAAFFASDSPFTGTLTIPNTTAALRPFAAGGAGQLTPGRWTLVVSDFAFECSSQGASCQGGARTGRYDVTVITKGASGGGIPAMGALAVAVHFATTATSDPQRPLPLAGASLESDADVHRLGTTLATLFATAGVTANVSFDLLDTSVRSAFATGINVDVAGPCSPLAQLFQSLPQTAPAALNVFLVSELHGGATGGNIVVGIDGTIPGPAGIPGTVASGAAVGTTDLRAGSCAGSAPDFAACGDDRTAYIIGHEIGHFLGLYHTSEAEGTLFDPLRDTPQCRCSQCAPTAERSAGHCADAANAPTTPYQVNVADCTGATPSGCAGGGDNLMFWLFSPSRSKGTLTAEQGQVIRANPLVQ